MFLRSGIEAFKDAELLLAFPEYKVPLPGGPRASQSDIFLLAKGDGQLISIMVEGKVSEPFGETVTAWKAHAGKGKEARLDYLCDLLELDVEQVDGTRYQLVHRTASALIEAKRFNAPNALMLVHSFSRVNEGFEDYHRFLSLFGAQAKLDSLAFAKSIDGVNLYCGWATGDETYLTR